MTTQSIYNSHRTLILRTLSYAALPPAIGLIAYELGKFQRGCTGDACGNAGPGDILAILLLPFGALLIATLLNLASSQNQAAPEPRFQKARFCLHLLAHIGFLIWGIATFIF